MEHEIGHILGEQHNLVDTNHIMYPVMLNWEYGLVENDFRLTTNYAEFIPFCTNKKAPVTIEVDSDEPRYGFDVYVVPSADALSTWQEGKQFEYFAGTGCSAQDVLKFKGTCNDVGPDSGLLVITGNKLSNPLTTFDVKYQMESKDFGMTFPVLFPGQSPTEPEIIIVPEPEPIPEPAPEPIPEPEIIIDPDAPPKPIPVIVSNDYGYAQIDNGEIKLLFGDTKQLKIYGDVVFTDSSDRIAVIVTYPDGISNGELIFPESDGTFETIFTLNNDSPDGTYEIMVTSKKKLIGFLHFTLVREPILEQILEPTINPPIINNQEEKITTEQVDSEAKNNLPLWIQNNARWWTDDSITDDTFVSGIQYLIEKRIIVLKAVTKSTQSQENIPTWIKTSAKLWVDGKNSENNFVSGLEFMVNSGIIGISSNYNTVNKETISEKEFDFEQNKNNIVSQLIELGKSSDFTITFDEDLSAKQSPPAKLHTYKITHTQDGHIGDLIFYEGFSSLFNESSFGKFSQIKVFLSNEHGIKPTTVSTPIIIDILTELVDWDSLRQKTPLTDWVLDTIESIPQDENDERVSIITTNNLEIKLTSKDTGIGFVELLISEKLS